MSHTGDDDDDDVTMDGISVVCQTCKQTSPSSFVIVRYEPSILLSCVSRVVPLPPFTLRSPCSLTIHPPFTHHSPSTCTLSTHHSPPVFLSLCAHCLSPHPAVATLPLGSGALAGNPFGVDRQFIAKELGMVGGSMQCGGWEAGSVVDGGMYWWV